MVVQYTKALLSNATKVKEILNSSYISQNTPNNVIESNMAKTFHLKP